MNGAESLVRTLVASGVETCFANPGTSEMHFVAALDRVGGLRCVLNLAEVVVTGFANGLANMHNARRACSPMVNIVGDHATYHRPFDAPLTADTEGLARAVSQWVRIGSSAETVAADGADEPAR